MIRRLGAVVFVVCALVMVAPSWGAGDDPFSFPAITRQNKPWTRWWWLGSAVDKENLSDILNKFHDAGVGGVEICPIYGASGYESRYLQYLSPQWLSMLDYTTATAAQLDMGVDLTTGTGWPMGGPKVSVEDASSLVNIHSYDVAAGNGLTQQLTGRISAVCAYSEDGQQLDLTANVKNGSLDWTAPSGTWHVYVVSMRGPAMKVKRAAPGGEGSVIDPFSTKSIDDYLGNIDAAFANYKGLAPRAQFHDSYEYQGNWTPELFEKFKSLRGYDLRQYLPALMGQGPQDTVARVMCDYRETMADLHTAYVEHWVQWAHAHGELAREQAHGAPANLLDLYATADIPETETFGDAGNENQMPMNKFASSAAHVTGKQLASSESFTWLGEHFTVTLAQVKPVVDYLFLSGINHMLFHGMAYSPKDAPWPGWLFYASVDFNQNGGLWHDLPAFNAYVARCQSILQSGQPSNDVLLYFPVYDLWQTPNTRQPIIQFAINGRWLANSPFYSLAEALESHGFGADFISDSQLATATCNNGVIVVGGNSYHALVLPETHVMPAATLANIVRLAKSGATVIVQNALPTDVPGLGDLDARRADLQNSLAQIPAAPEANGQTQGAPVGSGTVWVGKDPINLLNVADVPHEPMVEQGLRFIRRTRDGGYHYFIVNRSQQPVDGWVTLGTQAKSAVILDPMNPSRFGVATLNGDLASHPRIYLQLEPGESCFVRTYTDQVVSGAGWPYFQKADQPDEVTGTWSVHFVEGGPELPADFQADKLASWTTLGDQEAKRFAGTARYTITYDAPISAKATNDWLLDLGRVCESARVRVNGQDVGTVFSSPFEIHLTNLLHPGSNKLEIDVTNLATNRIEDLDRRGVNWKIMHEINFVGRNYQPFDSSDWPLRDSGLIGPVTVTPLLPLVPGNAK